MALDIIIQFVEGNITSEKFQEHLSGNNELISILTNNISRPSGIGEDLYQYINRYGISTLVGKLNTIDALEKFLGENKVFFNKNTEIEKLYSLMLDIQPSWLDLPGWYVDKMLKQSEDKPKFELKASLKAQILEDFKFTKKPRWIQSPNWLFVNERPLFFIGQIDISNVRHDSSQLYIFLDEITNQFHFTEQSM